MRPDWLARKLILHLPSSRITGTYAMPGYYMGPGNQNLSFCDHMASALLICLPSASSIVYKSLGSSAHVVSRMRKGFSYIVLSSIHHGLGFPYSSLPRVRILLNSENSTNSYRQRLSLCPRRISIED